MMPVNKNAVLELFLYPKKVLASRKLHVVLLVSLFAVGVVYLKQRSIHKQTNQQKIAEFKNLDADYSQVITEMQVHIEALNSRIKYLSMDNKRLSNTGKNLSEKIKTNAASIAKKLAETKTLQLELSNLDQNIIRNYENFVEQQEFFIKLKIECSQNADKNKKCINYAFVRDKLDSLGAELKSLKTKRELLVSQIIRFNVGL